MYLLTQFFANDALHWEPDWSRRDFASQAEEFMKQVGARGSPTTSGTRTRFSWCSASRVPIRPPADPCPCCTRSDGGTTARRSPGPTSSRSSATPTGTPTITFGSSRSTTRATSCSRPHGTGCSSAANSRSAISCPAPSTPRSPSSTCSCAATAQRPTFPVSLEPRRRHRGGDARELDLAACGRAQHHPLRHR